MFGSKNQNADRPQIEPVETDIPEEGRTYVSTGGRRYSVANDANPELRDDGHVYINGQRFS